MKRRFLLAAAAAAALGAPASALASSAQLSVESDTTVKPIGTVDGAPAYGIDGKSYGPTFDVTVVSDNGTPIPAGECLKTGSVHIVSAGKELGHAGCANASGVFRIYTSTAIANPVTAQAVVDADATFGGLTVAATQSNPVVFEVAPKIEDDSPFFYSASHWYPLRGHIAIATPRRNGVFVLRHKVGRRWRIVARQAPTRFGHYQFRVAVTTHAWQYFRITFVPRAGSGYLPTTLGVKVHRV